MASVGTFPASAHGSGWLNQITYLRKERKVVKSTPLPQRIHLCKSTPRPRCSGLMRNLVFEDTEWKQIGESLAEEGDERREARWAWEGSPLHTGRTRARVQGLSQQL